MPGDQNTVSNMMWRVFLVEIHKINVDSDQTLEYCSIAYILALIWFKNRFLKLFNFLTTFPSKILQVYQKQSSTKNFLGIILLFQGLFCKIPAIKFT